jgi:hypothetical protein
MSRCRHRSVISNGQPIKRSQIRKVKKQGARITQGHHDRRVGYFDPNNLTSHVRKQQLGIK